ncbi:MAG TPA: hypothetical protein VEL76_28055 [Gemmataceae bacterium]|nr:hypothetical protein [Gemmataceae bacterium]
MEPLGIVSFAGCRLPITRASFGYVADGNNDPQSDEAVPGWDFDVCTGPPLDPLADESLGFLLSHGMRFYSESDPIPLENADDLTGVELRLAEPFDPVSGEVYFTVYLGEHNDVSDLILRFVERRGSRYRMQVSALVHSVFEVPTRFEIDTWIERSPDR